MRESEFIVRPEHFLRYLRESLGLRRAETHLPRVGVIVFTSGDFRALHRTVHGQRKGWNRWLSVGTAGPRSVVVARSPIGAPAAIVTMEEMAALGCRTFLTFGACGSLVPDLVIGDLVLPTFAISDEGTSGLYGKARRLRPDPSTRCIESRARELASWSHGGSSRSRWRPPPFGRSRGIVVFEPRASSSFPMSSVAENGIPGSRTRGF
ncbi:MAG: hypothetical protein E6J96_08085 [Methanobacteriota archaeon]|nr:MAG: hypothetical protein E6J96_08085 [Euryarchaeota archaeon]